MDIYKCDHCSKMVEELRRGAGSPECCGSAMTKLEPGTTDGAYDKHVPVYSVDGARYTITVGAVEHPSTDAHYIMWIAVETTTGVRRWALKPGDVPKVEFTLTVGEIVVGIYAYCNLHGLWKA